MQIRLSPRDKIKREGEEALSKYIVKRVFLAVATLLIVCGITFFSMNAIPGGPFDGEKATSPAVRAVLEQRFNLDKPVPEQFVLYMNNLLHGDFGISTKTGRDIKTTIFSSFAVSARLGGQAIVVAVIIGVVLGSIAALNRNGFLDRLIIFLSTLFTSLPSFVFATLLLLAFCIKLQWIPSWSPESPNYILPVIALSASPMAYITRLTKTSMLDALGQDYVRTAKAKGVARWKIIFKHTLRNAMIPVITYVGPMTAYILTGSLVVERIFTIGGLGAKFVDCIINRDYPMIMGTTIFLATLMITMNLITDIVYKMVDPRIKLD